MANNFMEILGLCVYTVNRILYLFGFLQALNHIGLRVVLDVVYNHLQGSGPFDDNSVLDKVIIYY